MTVKYASFTTMVNELHLRRKIFAQHALKGGMMMGWGLGVSCWMIRDLGNPGKSWELRRSVEIYLMDFFRFVHQI